jgi:hypothetical protein
VQAGNLGCYGSWLRDNALEGVSASLDRAGARTTPVSSIFFPILIFEATVVRAKAGREGLSDPEPAQRWAS